MHTVTVPCAQPDTSTQISHSPPWNDHHDKDRIKLTHIVEADEDGETK